MSGREQLLIYGVCFVAIALCRVLPLLILKGRELPKRLEEALGLIPVAAFAALVANDLFSPDMFAAGLWPASASLIAALIVMLVSKKTASLMISALAGVISYALLLAL
ncbi:MAG: AzlD domain-containing protein [Atopobiaceae bacterium]|nr:AzlD domain-containing protein [Atopobiaceae bacterium]